MYVTTEPNHRPGPGYGHIKVLVNRVVGSALGTVGGRVDTNADYGTVPTHRFRA